MAVVISGANAQELGAENLVKVCGGMMPIFCKEN